MVRAGMTHEMADLLLGALRVHTKFLQSLDRPMPGEHPEKRKAFAHLSNGWRGRLV